MAQALVSCGPSLLADSCAVPGLCHCDRQTRSGDGKPHPGHFAAGASWGHVMQMQIDPQQAPDIEAVKQAAYKWGLIGILGAGFATLWHMADAFKELTWGERVTVLVASACAGAVAGPSGMIFSTWFAERFNESLSVDLKLAIGCVCAGLGSKLLDTLIVYGKRWYKGSLNSTEDLNERRMSMTPEERAHHANTCVFTPDRCGGACMHCPHREEHHHA